MIDADKYADCRVEFAPGRSWDNITEEERADIYRRFDEMEAAYQEQIRYWDIARWIFLQERNAKRARRIVARRKARRT